MNSLMYQESMLHNLLDVLMDVKQGRQRRSAAALRVAGWRLEAAGGWFKGPPAHLFIARRCYRALRPAPAPRTALGAPLA